MSSAVKKVSKKGVKKTAAVRMHPPYSDMVRKAIKELKERKGSSRQAVIKYIRANYKIAAADNVESHVRRALVSCVKSGKLVHTKGAGASGSFKVAEKVEGEKKKSTSTKKRSKSRSKSPKKAVTSAAAATTGGGDVAQKLVVKKAVVTKKAVKKTPKKAASAKPKSPKKSATKSPIKKKAAIKPKSPKVKKSAKPKSRKTPVKKASARG